MHSKTILDPFTSRVKAWMRDSNMLKLPESIGYLSGPYKTEFPLGGGRGKPLIMITMIVQVKVHCWVVLFRDAVRDTK